MTSTESPGPATRRAVPAAAALALLVGLGACQAQYRNHGYIPPESELQRIVVGRDTRASVEETLGSTGAGSVADDRGIYYVRSRMRDYASFAPEVVDREVVAISFDSAGVVSNVERFGIERGRAVPLSRRVTSSPSDNNGFLRQLLGNLGNFSPAGLSSE
ncbi:outer membrane protein assembly factor BamE [Sulfitobacter sp. LCG007]